jgi:aerobic carbon-monoxide dehydrogenase large subunit
MTAYRYALGEHLLVADGAVYRAVFLRMHPTGKAVLSLSEASQGQEPRLAQIAADELGIPPEDIKVVHEDTNRFGEDNSFNSNPSEAVGDNVTITARKLRDKAQLIAAWMLEAPPERLRWRNGHWFDGDDDQDGVRIQAVAARAFGGDSLPHGVEGSLDAQTTYRDDAGVREAMRAGAAPRS